jgi:DegV family protein with EDD domain
MSFVLVTDSTTDLPLTYVQKEGIPFISLSYIFGEESIKDDFGQSTDYTAFYKRMRASEMPSTAQINVGDYIEFFTPFLEKELDILYIAFSSNLSGSYNSSRIAMEELKEKYPSRKIVIVDSLCASMGEGLLVHLAKQKMNAGCGFDELAKWVEDTKQKVCHWFTVDDLNHLQRGGRVSKASAFIGTLMNIKPVLNVDENGKLIARDKVRGRKQALDALVEKMAKYAENPSEQTIFISHGDCLADAEYVAEKIKERFGVEKAMINYIGPVIGAHAGPGTVALFFLGKDRSL